MIQTNDVNSFKYGQSLEVEFVNSTRIQARVFDSKCVWLQSISCFSKKESRLIEKCLRKVGGMVGIVELVLVLYGRYLSFFCFRRKIGLKPNPSAYRLALKYCIFLHFL